MGILLAVVVGLCLSTRAGWTSGAAQHLQEDPRVVVVTYMDRADDVRGRRDFERLEHAFARHNPVPDRHVTFEYVQVVVGQIPSIAQAMAAIVRRRPTVIAATSHDVLEAAKQATSSIPILFISHEDPVEAGHVRSIAVPGVNRTGFTFHVPMVQKSLEILTLAYPHVRHVAVLTDGLNIRMRSFLDQIQSSRVALGIDVKVFSAENKQDVERVMAGAASRRVDAWYVPMGAAVWHDRAEVLRLMRATSVPVLYDRIALVTEGGLSAYEAQLGDPFEIWASQLVLLLDGVDAANIPVERPSRFKLAFNLDTLTVNSKLVPAKHMLKRADVLFTAARPYDR